MSSWDNLPPLACAKITCHLDPKEVLRARLVCRQWRAHMQLGIQHLGLSPACPPEHAGRLRQMFPDAQVLHAHEKCVWGFISVAGVTQGIPKCVLCAASQLMQPSSIPGLHLSYDDATGSKWDWMSEPKDMDAARQHVENHSMKHLALQIPQMAGLTGWQQLGIVSRVASHYPSLSSLRLSKGHLAIDTLEMQDQDNFQKSSSINRVLCYHTPLHRLPQLQTLHVPGSYGDGDLTLSLPVSRQHSLFGAHCTSGDRAAVLRAAIAEAHRHVWGGQGLDDHAAAGAESIVGSAAAAGATNGHHHPSGAGGLLASSSAKMEEHHVPHLSLLLASVPQLTDLWLQGDRVDFGDCWDTACLAALTQLTALRLGSIFAEDPQELAPLTQLAGLRSLVLEFGSEWWVKAGDLAVLSALPHLTSLTVKLQYDVREAEDDMWYDYDDDEDHPMDQDDWGALIDGLPGLEQLTLGLHAGCPDMVIEQIQGLSRNQLARSKPRVTLDFWDPQAPPPRDSPPALQPCGLITCLRIGAGYPGHPLTHRDLLQIAHLSALRELHLAVFLQPEDDGPAWPSIADVSIQARTTWKRLHDSTCPLSLPPTTGHAWPGNPLLYLAVLRHLQDLVLHVVAQGSATGPGRGVHMWHGSLTGAGPYDNDQPEESGYDADQPLCRQVDASEWTHVGSSDGDWEEDEEESEDGSSGEEVQTDVEDEDSDGGEDEDSDEEEDDEDESAGDDRGPMRGDSRKDRNLLPASCKALTSAHPAALEWLRGAGAGTPQWTPAGSESLRDRAARLQALCLGVTDAVATAWLSGMPQLQRLSLAGLGWLADGEGGALERVGRHSSLQCVHLALLGPQPAAATSTQQQGAACSSATAAGRSRPGQAGRAGKQGGNPRPGAGGASGLPAPSPAGHSFEYLPSLVSAYKNFKLGSTDKASDPVAAMSAMQPHLTIAPAHLPSQLKTLELHGVRYSRDWESDAATAALPRLSRLTLTNTHPLVQATACSAATAAAAANGSTAVGPDPAGAAGAPPSGGATWVPPPTALTNWHLKYVVARQPLLQRLVVEDPLMGLAGRWQEHPSSAKLKSRGLALLEGMQDCAHLELKVGHRLGWPAQEAAINTLASMKALRSLHLGATNMYAETYSMMSQLTQLTLLQFPASYQLDAHAMGKAVKEVGEKLPMCVVQCSMTQQQG